MNEYIVRIPLSSFVQYCIKANSEDEAIQIALEKDWNVQQVVNNLQQNGSVECFDTHK